MPFSPVEPEKIAASIVQQIELLVLRGILRPGERLPSERDLAERLGVSRPSVRDAIAALEASGLLNRRAGAGIYIADVLGSAFSPALTRLFATHDQALFDYIAFRRDMEGLAAERAARLGSETDIAVISAIFAKMEAANTRRDGTEEAALDAQFHLAIVEASHNVVMLHMLRSMYDLLQQGVFYNRELMFRQRTTRAALLDQHRAILQGISRREPAEARAAVEAHMDYVTQALRDARQRDTNEAVARQRLAHETGI